MELTPVSLLDEAIKDLKNLDSSKILEPQRILELENIRQSILKTNSALTKTRDSLAEAKAKVLLSEAYQRLIHDLHQSMLALGNSIEASNAESYGEETAKFSREKIPKIAAQILMQIELAKTNVDFETPKLIDEDIIPCIDDAVENAMMAVRCGDKVYHFHQITGITCTTLSIGSANYIV